MNSFFYEFQNMLLINAYKKYELDVIIVIMFNGSFI